MWRGGWLLWGSRPPLLLTFGVPPCGLCGWLHGWLQGYGGRGGGQLVKVVRPLLHHGAASVEMFRAIVSPAIGVADHSTLLGLANALR